MPVATGKESLFKNTTGNENTAIGVEALQIYVVAPTAVVKPTDMAAAVGGVANLGLHLFIG